MVEEVIIPTEHPDDLSLSDIDLRLTLYKDYIVYAVNLRCERIIHNNDTWSIGSFEQWLCWNKYSSLVIEDYGWR